MCAERMNSGQTLEDRLEALKPRATDAFSIKAIEGAQRALADIGNPLRFNFFSTALRILFEHMLGKLAPNDDVKQSAWYKPEKPDGNPTRSQRIVFAIQGGLADSFVRDQLGVEIIPLRKRLVGAVDDLSKHVHGREDTIILDVSKQDEEALKAVDALAGFFAAYHECRQEIIKPITEQLDEAAIDILISETIQEVDELASHHSIDEVYVDEMSIDIGATQLTYRVSGTVEVTLQWGSNSDVRRGDGAEIAQSFPFRCDIVVALESPWDLSLSEPSFFVDTSKWREAMEPDDWD